MSEKPPENLENIEKPPFLYHGSPHKGIEELEPRKKSYRDIEEGPQIFAGADLATASMFLMDKVAASGFFDGVPYALIIGSREEFIKNDKGGHIYKLPSDTFTNDPHKGLGRCEWTSEEKVKPIETIEYDSSLDAAIENGVQVYFVDENIYKQISKSEDHGLKILSDMESENQRREVNVKKFVAERDKNKEKNKDQKDEK